MICLSRRLNLSALTDKPKPLVAYQRFLSNNFFKKAILNFLPDTEGAMVSDASILCSGRIEKL